MYPCNSRKSTNMVFMPMHLLIFHSSWFCFKCVIIMRTSYLHALHVIASRLICIYICSSYNACFIENSGFPNLMLVNRFALSGVSKQMW